MNNYLATMRVGLCVAIIWTLYFKAHPSDFDKGLASGAGIVTGLLALAEWVGEKWGKREQAPRVVEHAAGHG